MLHKFKAAVPDRTGTPIFQRQEEVFAASATQLYIAAYGESKGLEGCYSGNMQGWIRKTTDR